MINTDIFFRSAANPSTDSVSFLIMWYNKKNKVVKFYLTKNPSHTCLVQRIEDKEKQMRVMLHNFLCHAERYTH